MADESCETQSEEDVLGKHKKEKKDLQVQIQKLKHSVPKGDKKKKKEVTEQIAKLEAELNQKQERELDELKHNLNTKTALESLETLTTDDGLEKGDSEVQVGKVKKPSKAQKRKEKKAALSREREDRIREQEEENVFSARNVEAQKIKNILSERNLQVKEIASDGNCLYNALGYQLSLREIQASNESLRQQTAEYMKSHEEDFIPFLAKDNGDCYTHEDFVKYCHLIASTTAWGGQLEIQAISKVLKTPIEVVQAEGPSVLVGEENEEKSLIITYHRHIYGLGEHYNSVQEKTEEEEDDFT